MLQLNHCNELHPRNQSNTHYLRWVNLYIVVRGLRHVSFGTCHVGHCLSGMFINQRLPLTAMVVEGLM